jgi:serine protease Do
MSPAQAVWSCLLGAGFGVLGWGAVCQDLAIAQPLPIWGSPVSPLLPLLVQPLLAPTVSGRSALSVQGQLIPTVTTDADQSARLSTVRLMGSQAAGSGVIVGQQGSVYTLLTNWHVVSLGDAVPVVLTPDGQRYVPLRVRQLGRADLAIVQFRSERAYRVAAIAPSVEVGDPVYAVGFPMFRSGSVVSTLDLGVGNLRVSPGRVTMQLVKPLDQGYGLGYSADVVVGMSGGPIFDSLGRLVGVNGRVKDRDPGFGSYVFVDGMEPDARMLDQISQASWGIAIDSGFRQKF